MTYEPRTYWTARAIRQGPDYVAYGGERSWADAQCVGFGDAIRQALGEKRFGWVLDFGCGSGRLAPVIAEHGRRYFGVDISAAGIAQACLARPDLEFLWMNEDRIPLDDGKVSLAFAITVFQHIVAPKDWDFWTSELRRVLKPDAPVFVIDAHYTERDDLAPHMCLRRPEEMAEALDRTVQELPSTVDHWVGLLRPEPMEEK